MSVTFAHIHPNPEPNHNSYPDPNSDPNLDSTSILKVQYDLLIQKKEDFFMLHLILIINSLYFN